MEPRISLITLGVADLDRAVRFYYASELFAEDYVSCSPPGSELRGVENTVRDITGLLAAFPDLAVTVEDIVAKGDKVAVARGAR